MTDIMTAPAYTDFSQFDQMRSLAKTNQDQALPAVAKQFESLFMSMLMKSMRDVNEVFSKDNYLHSSAEKQYQDMFDQQLSTNLSANHGLGLADMMVRQLNSIPASTPVKNIAVQPKVDSTPKIESAKVENLPSEIKTSEIKKTEEKAAPQLAEFKTPLDFVKAMWPYAKEAAKELGLNPKVLIAQAALETGWGKKIIRNDSGDSSHNLFNIKAGTTWEKEKVSVSTLEYDGSTAKKQMDQFRQYDDFKESFHDYVNLLKGQDRYQEAVSNTSDVSTYLEKLQEAGYATDPQYANKIHQIYDGDIMDSALTGLGVA